MINGISAPYINKVSSEEIENFVRAFIEDRLGKDSIKEVKITKYPNEFAIKVTLTKKDNGSDELERELQEIFINNNISTMVFVK